MEGRRVELLARGKGYGKYKKSGKVCTHGNCDILIVDEMDREIEEYKGVIVKSKIYDPRVLEKLASRGTVIIAGTGNVELEGKEITLDPPKEVLYG